MTNKYLDKTIILKPKKDPNHPKRSRSSFMFFCQETRSKVVAKHPDYALGSVSKELGKLWKALSEKKRDKYRRLSEADKKRYEEQMETYNNKLHMQELLTYQSSAQQEVSSST